VALRLVNSPSKTLDTQAYRAETLELRQNGIQRQQFLTRKYFESGAFNVPLMVTSIISNALVLDIMLKTSLLYLPTTVFLVCSVEVTDLLVSCFFDFSFGSFLFKSRKFMTCVSLSTMTCARGRGLSYHTQMSTI